MFVLGTKKKVEVIHIAKNVLLHMENKRVRFVYEHIKEKKKVLAVRKRWQMFSSLIKWLTFYHVA